MAGPRRSGKSAARAPCVPLDVVVMLVVKLCYSLLNCRREFYSFLESSLLALLLVFGGKSTTHVLLDVSKLVIPFIMRRSWFFLS
jgi:hypothetical protein